MTTIRPAGAADMAAVADLWHEGWHDGHAGHVPDGLTALPSTSAPRRGWPTPPWPSRTPVSCSAS